MLVMDKRKYFLLKSIWENQKYARSIPLPLGKVIQKYAELTGDPEFSHIDRFGVDLEKQLPGPLNCDHFNVVSLLPKLRDYFA